MPLSSLHSEAKHQRDHDGPLTTELEAVIKAPPSTVDEVTDLIRDKEVEMDQIVCGNPNVLREYKQRQVTIDSLEQEVCLGEWRCGLSKTCRRE